MSKYKIKSILNKISDAIQKVSTLDEMKKIAIDFIQKSEIDEDDKQKMVASFQAQTSIISFQQYFYNSLLYYEGDGVV